MALQRAIRHVNPLSKAIPIRLSSTKSPPLDVASLLQKPSWSIHTLLPNSAASDSENPDSITLKDLEHFSALSALPVPEDPTSSLKALRSHLHFVSTVREAETSSVTPLQSLRDETKEGERAAEFGMQDLEELLKGEEVVGKFHRRIRRTKGTAEAGGPKPDGKSGTGWNVLGTAKRRVGRYFVVDRVAKASD